MTISVTRRLFGILMVGALFVGVGLIASASSVVKPAPPTVTNATNATVSWSPESPVNFLAHGGRSNVVISPAQTNVNVTRG